MEKLRVGSNTTPMVAWRDFSGFRLGLEKLRTLYWISQRGSAEKPAGHSGSTKLLAVLVLDTGLFTSHKVGARKPVPAAARSSSSFLGGERVGARGVEGVPEAPCF